MMCSRCLAHMRPMKTFDDDINHFNCSFYDQLLILIFSCFSLIKLQQGYVVVKLDFNNGLPELNFFMMFKPMSPL